MNIKHFSISTLVGAIALFFIGFLLYAVLLESFFSSNLGSASGVARTDGLGLMPLLFLGNVATAALLTYIYMQWANISTFGTGLRAGLLIGFLIGAGFDLIQYSTTNIMNLTGTLVDIVVYAIMIGLCGGVIGLMLGRMKKK